MKLLLTSAGLTNDSIAKALLGLTGRPFSELKMAFVPTASNVEPGNKDWFIDDLVRCKNLGFQEIDIVDISALPKEMWLPRLELADVLLFEGGNTFHLMYWIEKSGLREILPEMLKTKVYVGISAGSMVVCKSLDMSTSKRIYFEANLNYESDEGLGFVDLLIRPHLNSPLFPDASMENLEKLAKESPKTFYALDDNSAIKIVDGEMEVISEGVWKKFN
ncbi:MAG: Type 1 glutamine amidotransferase-like domain-containing protein [Patescibacteria group bacterium]